MSDDTNTPGSFREHVQRLVEGGKLTAEEAAHLLEGEDAAPTPPSRTIAQYVEAIQGGETPGLNLDLEIEGYVLSVVQDSNVTEPTLNASHEGQLEMSATANALTLKRARRSDWRTVKAVLTVPFKPQHVKVEINGGSLSLCDIAGEMRAEVNGGNITMSTATALNAEVNGGNLRWTGLLQSGTHRTEVNAGNATLTLLPGSSVRLDAEVTLGNFKAAFPTQKSGGFMEAHYTGQLGGGEALLRCEVSAGQIKLLTGE